MLACLQISRSSLVQAGGLGIENAAFVHLSVLEDSTADENMAALCSLQSLAAFSWFVVVSVGLLRALPSSKYRTT